MATPTRSVAWKRIRVPRRTVPAPRMGRELLMENARMNENEGQDWAHRAGVAEGRLAVLVSDCRKVLAFLDKGPDMRPDLFMRGIWDMRDLIRKAVDKADAAPQAIDQKTLDSLRALNLAIKVNFPEGK